MRFGVVLVGYADTATVERDFGFKITAALGQIQVNLSSALTCTQIVAFSPITQSRVSNHLIISAML